MKTLKIGVVLLALLLAGMVMVPMVSAVDQVQDSEIAQEVLELSQPIRDEIESNVFSLDQGEITDKNVQKYNDLSDHLIKKYDKNLESIIGILEKTTATKLSQARRENLKKIIVRGDISNAAREEFKKKLVIKDGDSEQIFVSSNTAISTSAVASLPDSLILVQVAADVNGGTGVDGAGIEYTVNGGNQLYSIIYNTHPGSYTYYECHFRDEDVPSSATDDALYDAYRLARYGTIEDTQSFIIYSSGTVEFGSNWDNGYTYGYIPGQHGGITRSFGSGTRIYLSNVWNHAMDIYNRNPNMAKITYYY